MNDSVLAQQSDLRMKRLIMEVNDGREGVEFYITLQSFVKMVTYCNAVPNPEPGPYTLTASAYEIVRAAAMEMSFAAQTMGLAIMSTWRASMLIPNFARPGELLKTTSSMRRLSSISIGTSALMEHTALPET